jgi:hypothetical protein
MQSFLKVTKPYAIDPDSMAFAIHGTGSHAAIEAKAKELGIPTELSATGDGRNAIDLLEYENGNLDLLDTKTWGSFKVAKVLGLTKVGRKPDPSGEMYKTNGKWGKAGSPKMVDIYDIVPEEADKWDVAMQLNRYRIMLEDENIPINCLRVHAIVRDGGTITAKNRGVYRNTYMIPIPKLNDDEVREYFYMKNEQLVQAINQGYWEEPCSIKERWDGNRCKNFCEVSSYCVLGMGRG